VATGGDNAGAQLVNAAREVAEVTEQVILATRDVCGAPKDNGRQMKLANATRVSSPNQINFLAYFAFCFPFESNSLAQVLPQALDDVRHAATGLSPGIRECDEAIAQVENAVADIEGATMAVAFGNLEGTAGKTHQDCQQELADLTRTLTDALKALEGGDTKRGANILATAVPVMSSLVRTAVATTHNKNTQQSLLTAAKDLSENLLGLLMSVRENASGTGSPAAIGQKAKQTRGAIDNLNSSLRAGADSARQIEQANRDIQEAAKLLTQPPDSGVTYKDVKVALKYESQDFVRTVTELLNAAKVNVDDVGQSARAVASVLPVLIRSTRNAAATTPDQKAKAALVANGKKVIETAAQFIAAAQGVNNDPKNRSLHMALAAAASAVTAAVSALLDACYAGATGERECEDAVFQLGRIVADLDACALFAAAGQIDAEEIAPGLTYEVLTFPFSPQTKMLILRNLNKITGVFLRIGIGNERTHGTLPQFCCGLDCKRPGEVGQSGQGDCYCGREAGTVHQSHWCIGRRQEHPATTHRLVQGG